MPGQPRHRLQLPRPNAVEYPLGAQTYPFAKATTDFIFHSSDGPGLLANYEKRPETKQIRVFRSNYNDQIDYIALIEARAPFADPRIDLSVFSATANRIDLINEYSPYWTRGHLAGVFPAPSH